MLEPTRHARLALEALRTGSEELSMRLLASSLGNVVGGGGPMLPVPCDFPLQMLNSESPSLSTALCAFDQY